MDEEAKVSRKLKTLNVRRVLILILMLLIFIPLLNANVFSPEDASIENKAMAIYLQLKINTPE